MYSKIIGASFSTLILLAAAGFFGYAWWVVHGFYNKNADIYRANFVSVNMLKKGASVEIAGVRVGRVIDISLDQKTDMAVVSFTLGAKLSLPEDSSLSIGSVSPTSDHTLVITPGRASKKLVAGSLITNTQEPLTLEQQISNYIFGTLS